jgi:hypothetical protein
MTEILKLSLTRSALERLFGDDVEIEVALRKQVCRDIASRHFKELADRVLWELSYSMKKDIEDRVAEVAKDFVEHDPTEQRKWRIPYPASQKVRDMIATACDEYFTDKVKQAAANAVKEVLGNQTIEQSIARLVKNSIREQISTVVDEAVTSALKEVKPIAFKLERDDK